MTQANLLQTMSLLYYHHHHQCHCINSKAASSHVHFFFDCCCCSLVNAQLRRCNTPKRIKLCNKIVVFILWFVGCVSLSLPYCYRCTSNCCNSRAECTMKGCARKPQKKNNFKFLLFFIFIFVKNLLCIALFTVWLFDRKNWFDVPLFEQPL